MNIEEVRLFALSLAGAQEDMPYGPDWVVFRVHGKIFLHIWLEAPQPTCAVKLPPDVGEELRVRLRGVKPAYHLNKKHWNDLSLNILNDDLVRKAICQSHYLVFSKLPKAVRDNYDMNTMPTNDFIWI